MAFSNPFDDPQGEFYILRNAQGNSVCGRNNAPYRQAGTLCVSRNLQEPPAVAGSPLAYLTPTNFTQLQEVQ